MIKINKAKAVLRSLEEHDYLEEIECDDPKLDNFEILFVEDGTFKDELNQAKKLAKKKDGVIYTQIDSGGSGITYWKGIHFVDRLGYCVLRRNEK